MEKATCVLDFLTATHGKKLKRCCCSDFFFIPRGVLEMNGLDKIARRSKRVSGAIADLWGSHYVCPSQKIQ